MTLQLPGRNNAVCRRRIGGDLLRASLLCLLAFAQTAAPQGVLMPRPDYPLTPPALQEVQRDETVLAPPAPAPADASPDLPLFRWGPVDVRPHMYYRFLYGDGIQSSPGEQETTAVNEISPGLFLGLGQHWTLDYTPTVSVYSNDKFKNTVNHAVYLNGGTTYEDWVFGLSQGYMSADSPLVETGQQTSQETYSTALNASDKLGSLMLLQCSVNQVFRFVNQSGHGTNTIQSGHMTNTFDDVTNSREWSTLEWLNYQFWPRFSGALGVGFGYVDVEKGFDSMYERPQGRITWQPTDKLSCQVHGGVEVRQFMGSGAAGTLVNPIVDGSVGYRPFETTSLSLSVAHVVATSDLQDQITESTNVGVTLDQRLFRRLNLSVGFSYSSVSYVSTRSNASAQKDASEGRDDDSYSINVRLGTRVLKRGTIAVFYQYSDNISTKSGFGYSSNQGGLELGYRY